MIDLTRPIMFITNICKLSTSTIIMAITEFIKLIFIYLGWILFFILREIHAVEQLFIGATNIYTLMCQLLIFTMFEIVFIGPPEVKKHEGGQTIILSLSTLLVYNVFGYFLMKIKLISEGNMHFGFHGQFSARLYIKLVAKVILEWVKAIAIVACIRDQGIKFNLHPYFTPATFIYYIATEKIIVDSFIKLFEQMDLSILESMEHLYIPIFLNIYAISCAIFLGIWMCTTPYATYALFASYFTIYLRFKDMYCNYMKTMTIEKKTYKSFQFASDSDLKKWNDICAVCLNTMSKAKITPCHHLFHPRCLRLCLRNSLRCPLCKHDFSLSAENER